MAEQTKHKKPFYKTFGGSLVIITSICIVLYFSFFASLGSITNHGKEVVVPELTGKSLTEVATILEQAGFDMIVDSTYEPEQPALMVLDQQPVAGVNVKPGRTIMISVNKLTPPTSPMPNLINLSFRSALLVLKSNKLVLGDTIVKPDMAKGAVLAQQINGVAIQTGTLIAQGTKIDLVVGGGLANVQVVVPDIMNLTYDVALSILDASNLNYDIIYEGEISDTSQAVIIYQLPAGFDEEGNPVMVNQNETIDIKVSQNP